MDMEFSALDSLWKLVGHGGLGSMWLQLPVDFVSAWAGGEPRGELRPVLLGGERGLRRSLAGSIQRPEAARVDSG